MEEGQLARWFKKEGDTVSTGEPLFEVDTDKATMEAQALTSGVLRKIIVKEGETVPLGDIVAVIGDADEDISAMLGESGKTTKNKANDSAAGDGATGDDKPAQQDAPTPAQETTPRPEAQPRQGQPSPPASGGNGAAPPDAGRLIVSPIAARMAAEASINLQNLTGSGPGGRIVKRDIEAAMNAPQPATTTQPTQAQPVPNAQPQPAPVQRPAMQGAASYRDEPNSEMRRTIARRLATSIGPVPHFFLTIEVEMDAAADLRRKLNALDENLKISFNDIIIKVAATALMSHPQVNASFQDQATRYYDAADVGVAVALEDGLITPVIRSANTKSIGAISREVRELAERARARRLKPEEYTGATFSVSNLGMFGIDEFTAVINPPEAAIIAVGAVAAKPVVRDGEVAVRQMMRVTMSCDHRVVDGATGAQFLQTFKALLENPLRLLTA